MLVLITLTAASALTGCKTSRVGIVNSPYSSGQTHVEPVVYNGRRYNVAFRFQAAQNLYDVRISAAGRKLQGRAGDRKVVEQLATSAVRHFACPSGLKGQIVPGSQVHDGQAWKLKARCA